MYIFVKERVLKREGVGLKPIIMKKRDLKRESENCMILSAIERD